MKASLKVKLFDPKFILMIAFGCTIICTIILYPFLPNDLPMQFSLSGSVNWTLPKALGVCCIPALALFISANLLRQDRLDFVKIIPVLLILVINIGVLGYAAFIM